MEGGSTGASLRFGAKEGDDENRDGERNSGTWEIMMIFYGNFQIFLQFLFFIFFLNHNLFFPYLLLNPSSQFFNLKVIAIQLHQFGIRPLGSNPFKIFFSISSKP